MSVALQPPGVPTWIDRLDTKAVRSADDRPIDNRARCRRIPMEEREQQAGVLLGQQRQDMTLEIIMEKFEPQGGDR